MSNARQETFAPLIVPSDVGSETRSRARWSTWLVVGLAVVLGAAIVWMGVRPGWQHLNSDFPNYYTAAKLLRTGTPLDRAYEWVWFQREAIKAGVTEQPLVGFVPQPPMVAVPMLPFSWMSPMAAKRTWIAANGAMLFLCVLLIADVTMLSLGWATLIVLACGGPLIANFRLGQYYVLMLLLLLLAYRDFRKRKQFRCGAILALAGSLKLFPFGFALMFLVRRQWRALAGMLVSTVLLGGMSLALFGEEIHRKLLIEVLPRALRGELLAPYVPSSFPGLWRHLFLFEPQLNPLPFFRSSFLCAFFVSLTSVFLFLVFVAVVGGRRCSDEMAWSLTALWLSMTAALAVSYHYSVVIFPAALAIGYLRRTELYGKSLIVFAIYACACSFATRNALLWLGTTLLFFLLSTAAEFDWPNRTEVWAGVLAALAVVALLTWSGMKSLDRRQEDYAHRITNGPAGIRASQPGSPGGGMLSYLEMNRGGYRLVICSPTSARYLRSSMGAMSAAVSENSTYIYVELAGRAGGIYRADAQNPNGPLEWVARGTEPALSADGKWLAFVIPGEREDQIYRLETNHGTSEKVAQLSDVLEVAVTNAGSVIASVGPASRAHLIATTNLKLGRIGGAVRYPAISPAGDRLGFSRRQGEYWQLYVRDLGTGKEVRLSDLPCNTVEPFWTTEKELLYASDCGRGLGLSAISRVRVPEL